MGLSNAERQAKWRAKRNAEIKRLRKTASKAEPASQELAEARKEIARLRKENEQLRSAAAHDPKSAKWFADLEKIEHAKPTETTVQAVDRLRALWKSGRDKYTSFFAVLDEVRKEVGDDKFDAWCMRELMIGPSVITKVTGILHESDAKRIKADLKRARSGAGR